MIGARYVAIAVTQDQLGSAKTGFFVGAAGKEAVAALLQFGGDSWTLKDQPCGDRNTGYALDQFTGTLSEDSLEFHAENDDGYNPTEFVVFRRTACVP